LLAKLKQWLIDESGRFIADIFSRGRTLSVDEQEIAEFLRVAGQNVGLLPDIVKTNMQFWAITAVGYDAPLAAEWLWILRLLKEGIGRYLPETFTPQECLACWQALDAPFTYATVEISLLATDLDRVEMVEKLVALQQKMTQLETTKTQFLTISAHELRTPLTIIEGYAKMIRAISPDEISRIHLFLDGLDNGIRRMQQIIEDIIDVAALEMNAYAVNYQELFLHKLVEAAAQKLMPHFQDRLVELVIMPPEFTEPIYGDPERLTQVFVKLLENALKFTPEGGRVTVTIQLVMDSSVTAEFDGYVDVCISDTGIGIDEADLDRIFEKFTSTLDAATHSSSKTNFMGGGPGLGLPIAKGIVEAHNGRIWVESLGTAETQYPGSSFHVELPIRRAA